MEKIICRTPTPGKRPTRILRWKYDLIRRCILQALSAGENGIEFRHLSRFVEQCLKPEVKKRIGSISWYTTTVKLELEVAGEITRISGANPQRLIKTRSV